MKERKLEQEPRKDENHSWKMKVVVLECHWMMDYAKQLPQSETISSNQMGAVPTTARASAEQPTMGVDCDCSVLERALEDDGFRLEV